MAVLIFLPLLLLASYVSAHGFVFQVDVNGQLADTGPTPGSGGNHKPSAIRRVSTQDPQYGVQNPSLSCGPGARPAQNNLRVRPGDHLGFNWRGGDPAYPWIHNVGPLMTYLADCGDKPCSQFDPRNARWYKIHQAGKKPNSDDWYQKDLTGGGRAIVEIPKNLTPGNYLVRHEIIALHIATSPPGAQQGAEFYPSCIQLLVEGSGTGRLRGDTASFPGSYTAARNQGIWVPDIFNPGNNYIFPGPSLATVVDAQRAESVPTEVPNTSANPSSTSAADGPTGSGTSNSCNSKRSLRRRRNLANQRRFNHVRRFHHSASGHRRRA